MFYVTLIKHCIHTLDYLVVFFFDFDVRIKILPFLNISKCIFISFHRIKKPITTCAYYVSNKILPIITIIRKFNTKFDSILIFNIHISIFIN